MKNPQIGRVTLVGAGPGDPDLLTVKALKAIAGADVVVYDRLVSPEVLALVPEHIQRVDVGKRPGAHRASQEEINETLISLALQGLNVTRLKGGDPLIFGRGGEELQSLRDAGVVCSCVPGITAAQGAASSTEIPLTHRGLATGLRYVTGHRAADASLDLDWASLADANTTLVVYMGAETIPTIARQLIAHGGLAASTPVVAVTAATTPRERCRTTTLASLSLGSSQRDADDPVLFIIGEVAGLAGGAERVKATIEDWDETHALARA